jgi:hypothetical protein
LILSSSSLFTFLGPTWGPHLGLVTKLHGAPSQPTTPHGAPSRATPGLLWGPQYLNWSCFPLSSFNLPGPPWAPFGAPSRPPWGTLWGSLSSFLGPLKGPLFGPPCGSFFGPLGPSLSPYSLIPSSSLPSLKKNTNCTFFCSSKPLPGAPMGQSRTPLGGHFEAPPGFPPPPSPGPSGARAW